MRNVVILESSRKYWIIRRGYWPFYQYYFKGCWYSVKSSAQNFSTIDAAKRVYDIVTFIPPPEEPEYWTKVYP